MINIEKKLLMIFLGLLLLGILATAFISINLITSNYINSVEDSLINEGHLISKLLNEGVYKSEEDADRLIAEVARDINARITLIDDGGNVVADSGIDKNILENHGMRPEILEAKDKGVGIEKRYSDSLKIDMYYVALKIEGNDSVSIIRLAMELNKIKEINSKMVFNVGVATVVGMLLSVVIGVRFLRELVEPIKRLSEATRKIADGEYGEEVKVVADDEIGNLAENFNKMSSELAIKIDELNDANVNKNAILSSMSNGVIAVDTKKKIMYINPNAREFLGIETNVQGKHILEILRDSVLYKHLEKMIDTIEPFKVEIEIDFPRRRILKLYSNPILGTDFVFEKMGIVIIIEDVTEVRQLENMRKDFVANVSHELKTPLTSIKGFAETLKEGAGENKEIRDRFLNIIDIEAARLTMLIEDLLVLSDIEKRNSFAGNAPIDIVTTVKEIGDLLSNIAEKEDIQVVYEVQEDLGELRGNPSWFKQMLINLIDNGIKYTPDGGRVNVKITATRQLITVSIKDNGMGISEEHLPRLFERFYRVDKARSRKIGGTGLGLAIVKHVVINFNGNIDVKSEVGKGTEFIITLPIEPETSYE